MTVCNETGLKVYASNQIRAVSDMILVLMVLGWNATHHVGFNSTHFPKSLNIPMIEGGRYIWA